MENLFTTEDFVKAANLKRFKADRLAEMIMRVLKLDHVNTLYKNASGSTSSNAFVDNILSQIGVSYKVRPEDLEKLPKEGPFITVSNHPYGGIDGLILMRLVGEQRQDFKVMANFLLDRVGPLKERILPVNPFDATQSNESSYRGMKLALQHLKGGHALGFFPAGEVSSLQGKQITDKAWNESAIKLIQKAGVPIVPIYFKGRNSVLFHLLGLINPALRTVKLPSELLNKGDRIIEVRIGKPISLNEQESFTDTERFGRYIRSKTYALGTTLEVKRFFRNSIRRKPTPEPIQDPQDQQDVIAEMRQLEQDHRLFKTSQFTVYCTPSALIPKTLQEIGRLREITYREVGEGTNHACDLDEFDIYYHHLIIWDHENHAIVGGYRIGKGADIMRGYGIRGFYIHQLFKIKPGLFPIMTQSLELGRSYIVKEYQRKPLPLFLLWKGILVFILKHPEYRYLTGPVSISNQFSGFSKGILIEFLRRHFYNEDYARFVVPRNAFKPDPKDIDIDILLESSQKDLSKLDKIIQEIEPLGLNLPVLFKKYIKQNAQVIGFNTDPKFNDALDGLMLLDIYDVPGSTIISLMKELNDPVLNKAMQERNLV